MRALTVSAGRPARAAASAAAASRSACSATVKSGPPGAVESSMLTPTAPAAIVAATVSATSAGRSP